MDEATPHLHVDYIPVATEQTRGLSTRVSMKQALKQQGFTGLGRKQTEWKAWMDREKDMLTEIAQQHEFEIISLGSNRRHMDLPEYENMELKEALEEERSFSDRLLEGIDRVLDMLERHLPKQLLDLVDKARDLLPEHQSYRQEQQREKGHSWGDMSL